MSQEEKESSETDSEESEEEEVEEPKPQGDVRLQKSVDLLIKQTKIDKKKLDGLSLEEQFDRLTFLLENMPTQKKSKNKPVVPLPTDTDAMIIGKKVKEAGGKDYYLFKPTEWIGVKREKNN